MVPRFCLCFAAAVAFLGFAGCSSDDQADTSNHRSTAQTTHHQKKSDDDDDHDMNKPPHIGMTKAQVRAAYGEPISRDVDDDGETWVYRLNLGDAMVAGLNPFDFGGHSRLRAGTISFGANGRVKKFHWDAGNSDD